MLRLRQIALVAADLDPAVGRCEQELGLAVAFNDPRVVVYGLRNAVMPVGDQFLEVVSPIREGTAGGRYLARRGGDGGYMVILQADEHPRRRQHVIDLGIRRVGEHRSDEYTMMQLHPADTGGSFLEIDEQVGGEDMASGPWEPAGPDWQRARRTEVVSGIGAAEIQSPEPERVAQRWSDILQLPLQDVDGGRLIALDNATLRFVEAIDGRGEGLGGIDLVATARDAAGSTTQICGMRITLV